MTVALIILLLCSLPFSNSHVNKRQAVTDFQAIVKQKTQGNKIPQCPCVIHPESRQCISYDSRYVAVNYEEAILSFLDLSRHEYPAPLINGNTFSCQSEECRQCYSLLYYKLGDVGFIPRNHRSSINPIPQAQLRPNLCPRYNFPRPKVVPVPPVVVPSYVQNMISAGGQFRSTHPTSSNGGRNRNQNNNGPPAAVPSSAFQRNNNRNNQNQNSQQPPSQNSPGRNNPRNNQQQRVTQNRPRNFQQQRQQFRQPQRQFQQQQQPRQQFQQPRQQFQQPQFQQPQQQFQPPQQQFQPPQFQGQTRWNGRFWEPINHAIPNPWNPSGGHGENGNGGGGGSGGNFPQTPVVIQPHFPTAPVQPGWSGGGGNSGGSGSGGGGGWGGGGWGGGGGNNNDQHGGLFGFLGGGFKKRHKRAAPDVIGQRFTISCTDRGQSEDDMLALCGYCWTWRQLPENYFPRIINELSCKTDDFCLSGWGECVQQYRNVDVLRRENGRWIPTVITTATCCDCRVRAGTEIHSLVIGDKK